MAVNTTRNPEMVEALSADFRRLYNPTHAFADAVNMALMFPGLRGFWPGSVVGSSGEMNDLSGNGLHLTNTSNSLFDNDGLAPHTEYDGTADYHSHVDAADFDIIGNEGYITNPGLTMGGWFYFNNAPSTAEFMMAKGNASTANTAYELRRTGSGEARFGVGNTVTIITATSTDVLSAGSWYCVVATYIPSTSLTVMVNGAEDTNVTSIPATLVNSADAFSIGARAAVPDNYMDGRVSLAFLCASALPDTFIDIFYQMTAPLFKTSI